MPTYIFCLYVLHNSIHFSFFIASSIFLPLQSKYYHSLYSSNLLFPTFSSSTFFIPASLLVLHILLPCIFFSPFIFFIPQSVFLPIISSFLYSFYYLTFFIFIIFFTLFFFHSYKYLSSFTFFNVKSFLHFLSSFLHNFILRLLS